MKQFNFPGKKSTKVSLSTLLCFLAISLPVACDMGTQSTSETMSEADGQPEVDPTTYAPPEQNFNQPPIDAQPNPNPEWQVQNQGNDPGAAPPPPEAQPNTTIPDWGAAKERGPDVPPSQGTAKIPTSGLDRNGRTIYPTQLISTMEPASGAPGWVFPSEVVPGVARDNCLDHAKKNVNGRCQ